jgi:hypothetical protein
LINYGKHPLLHFQGCIVLLKLKHELQKKCKEGRKVLEQCVEERTKGLKLAQILSQMSEHMTQIVQTNNSR